MVSTGHGPTGAGGGSQEREQGLVIDRQAPGVFPKAPWVEGLIGDPTRKRSPEEIGILLEEVSRTITILGGSPVAAAVTDQDGRILEVNIDQRTLGSGRGAHAARVTMANAFRMIPGASDLHGYNLHLLDHPLSNEAMGQIWLFRPSNVFLTPFNLNGTDTLTHWHRYIPVAGDYWEVLKREQGTDRIVGREVDSRLIDQEAIGIAVRRAQFGGKLESLSPTMPYNQDRWIAEILGDLTKPQDLTLLMRRLHVIASRNPVNNGGGPFAAAVLDSDNRIVSVNVNRVRPDRDPGAHGEQTTMRNAMFALGRDNLEGFTLVSTSACCIGCAEQVAHIGPSRVIDCCPKETVEARTPFTEGYLDPNFWRLLGGIYGINRIERFDYMERITSQGPYLPHRPFGAFEAVVSQDPEKAYLRRGSMRLENKF